MAVEKLAYRPGEAAALLGMSRDSIFRLLARGEIRSFRAGHIRLISAEALKQFIAERETYA